MLQSLQGISVYSYVGTKHFRYIDPFPQWRNQRVAPAAAAYAYISFHHQPCSI